MAAVAIVALALAGIALIGEGRARAEREQCRASLRQIALALGGYQYAHGAFPPGTVPSGLPPERRLSWCVLILNWSDYQGLVIVFEKDLPWDSARNRLPKIEQHSVDGPVQVATLNEPVSFLFPTCRTPPSGSGPGMPATIPYVGIAGVGTDAAALPRGHPRAGVFGYDRQARTEDITDGASATMMLAETSRSYGPWTAGGPATVRGLDPSRPRYIGGGRQFGGVHRGGAMVAFADGSVRFVRDTIDPKLFEALATIAGGEPVGAVWGD
jgi:prepilin-type processing-associated H-X9-DG protein